MGGKTKRVIYDQSRTCLELAWIQGLRSFVGEKARKNEALYLLHWGNIYVTLRGVFRWLDTPLCYIT